MNRLLFLSFFLLTSSLISQNVQVDWTTYTPQELIEDILIDSNCIENIIVTNVVGGDFNGIDESYGYFDATGSSFPFQSGIVLSTGKLINAEGPNDSLSDDDAPGWVGDSDLENVLNESNTTNATILEFEFTSVASQISFRYLFSSEEYQENNPNTCIYSDLFGFLIRPVSDTQYENIALIPNTTIPVKVTTILPDIPNGCNARNEDYFESFNGPTAPINMDGQTKVMLATANVIPNESYHVKLVIADHVNYRYDSAVFLEAGSFEMSTDLGDDLLIGNNTALCENETHELNASQPGNNSYAWFKDSVLLPLEINSTFTVTSSGTYNVEVTLESNCISYGQIKVEYISNPIVFDSTLVECDLNQDGITSYNLFDATDDITNKDNTLNIIDYYITALDADQNNNPITNPTDFENSIPNQIVYARVESQNSCHSISNLQLEISNNLVLILPQVECNNGPISGITEFDLDNITASFVNQIPGSATVSYYETESDAFNGVNTLFSPYENTIAYYQDIYVKINNNNQCYAIETVSLNVLDAPEIAPDSETYYCTDTFPNTIQLSADVLSGTPSNFTYNWLLNNSSLGLNSFAIDINEIGVYTVEVTDISNCTTNRNITVLESSSAIIDAIQIEEGTYNNTVTINASGIGNYEYSLNSNGPYFSSNIFTDVLPGFHSAYVRDLNGCETVSEEVSLLGFPRFFTPNDDGFNDTWAVFGVSENFNQDIDIQIFDRFGKILIRLNYQSNGWNGISDNGMQMPSSDYWYLVNFSDGRIFKGHFTLKR